MTDRLVVAIEYTDLSMEAGLLLKLENWEKSTGFMYLYLVLVRCIRKIPSYLDLALECHVELYIQVVCTCYGKLIVFVIYTLYWV